MRAVLVAFVLCACGAPSSSTTPDPDEDSGSEAPSGWSEDVLAHRLRPPAVEVPVPEGGDRSAATSAAAREAFEAFDEGRHLDAAVLFHNIVEADRAAEPAQPQTPMVFEPTVEADVAIEPSEAHTAMFFLGQALYHAGLWLPARAAFDEIMQTGASHPHFVDTMPWAFRFAHELPDPSWSQGHVWSYASVVPPDASPWVLYALARAHYDRGDFGLVEERAAPIPTTSVLWVRATLLRALAAVRAGRVGLAAEQFSALIERPVGPGEEYAAYTRELARISLARIYYQRGAQSSVVQPDTGRVVINALVLFGRVDRNGPFAAEATIGEVQSLLLLGQREPMREALARLPDAYLRAHPNVYAVWAADALIRCELDEARAHIASARAQTEAVESLLERLFRAMEDNEQVVQALTPVVAGGDDLEGALDGFVSLLRSDHDLRNQLAMRGALQRQRARFDELSERLSGTSLETRLMQDMFVADSFALDVLADRIRGHANRHVEETREVSSRLDTLAIEIVTRSEPGQSCE